MAGKTYLILLISLPVVLLQQAEHVFVTHDKAHSVLSRWRRANSPFEEFKKGNLERECKEEICSYEEAREVFENDDKTREFWNLYTDGDQCKENPCKNDGSCKDGIGEYTCLCNAGYEGKNCETPLQKMCSLNNGGCDQYCKPSDKEIICSCAPGYELGEDLKSCIATEKYSCGKRVGLRSKRSLPDDSGKNITANPADSAPQNSSTPEEVLVPATSDVDDDDVFDYNPNTRVVGGQDCEFGECPWQAVLLNENNNPFCGGTILSKYFILTAAHCMNQTKYFKVVVGALNTLKTSGAESTHKVERIIVHPKFVKLTYNYDIAVIKLREAINFTDNIIPACLPDPEFAEQVLMKNDEPALVSGFGRVHERGVQATKLQRLYVPYVSRQTCKESSKYAITENMFCAGYDTEMKDACQGDSGGPHVTPFREVFFVTGIVSWGEGCAQQGKYGVYTKVSHLHKWLKGVLKRNQ